MNLLGISRLAIVAGFVVSWSSAPASAALLTLIDENSVVQIDPAAASGASLWQVDGVDQLNLQWFWFRVGNTAEQAINTIPLALAGTFDTDFDSVNNGLFARYVQPGPNGFTIEVTYNLVGGAPGSGTSDLAEQIRIINTSGSALPLTFFQYCDLNLSGNALDDTVQLSNANTMTQSDLVLTVGETVVTPAPAFYEVGNAAALLAKLTDGSPTTLNNNGGPISGDVAWAFQWNFNLAPGSSVLISKDKQLLVVPEPATIGLLAMGLLALVPVARRRRK